MMETGFDLFPSNGTLCHEKCIMLKIRGFVIISCTADFTALHQCGGAASQDSKVRVEVGEFD